MALIDYRGFRLVALTVLPISRKTIIYGTHEASKMSAEIHADDAALNKLMKKTARRLNLRKHKVGRRGQIGLYAAVDVEGHKSEEDNRFYLVDFARTFPPQLRMVSQD